jgi:hypothetical protein
MYVLLPGSKEGIGRSLGPFSARPADAMNVVLRIGRVIEVDNVAHIIHIWKWAESTMETKY